MIRMTLLIGCLLALSTGCSLEGDGLEPGPDADPSAVQPAVSISATRCLLADDQVWIESELDVILEVGQGVEAASRAHAENGSQFLVSTLFECGSWTRVALKQPGTDVGCQRAEGQPERQYVETREVLELELVPPEVDVTAVAIVVDEVLRGDEILRAQRTVYCR